MPEYEEIHRVRRAAEDEDHDYNNIGVVIIIGAEAPSHEKNELIGRR